MVPSNWFVLTLISATGVTSSYADAGLSQGSADVALNTFMGVAGTTGASFGVDGTVGVIMPTAFVPAVSLTQVNLSAAASDWYVMLTADFGAYINWDCVAYFSTYDALMTAAGAALADWKNVCLFRLQTNAGGPATFTGYDYTPVIPPPPPIPTPSSSARYIGFRRRSQYP